MGEVLTSTIKINEKRHLHKHNYIYCMGSMYAYTFKDTVCVSGQPE